MTVDLHCSHAKVGEHLLPFFLKIDKGKLIFIRISCRTLAPSEAGLVICRNDLRFYPSPLSSKNIRVQMCEMYNPTLHKLNFKAVLNDRRRSSDRTNFAAGTEDIDVEIHEEQEVKKYIFQILNPEGQIAPQSFAVITFTFKPQHLTFSQVKNK